MSSDLAAAKAAPLTPGTVQRVDGLAHRRSVMLRVPLPAGTAAGDQIVVAATLANGKTVSMPTGYTAIPGSPFVSGTSNTSAQLAVFRRTTVAGDTSVSLAFSTKTAKAVVIAVYRGVDPATA